MKPPAFAYYAPATLQEALQLVARLGPDARVLAGGQSLVPMMNLRLAHPRALIDLNRLSELNGIRAVDGGLEVAAMTRYATLERSELVAEEAPLLAAALPYIANPAVRNRGTIGGSLVHNDPAAELPAVLAALDGSVTLTGTSGTRTLTWSEFFVGYLTTAIAPGEILTSIHLPSLPAGSGTAFLEVARRHGDFALAGVALTVTRSPSGVLAGGRIALFGVSDGPVRARSAEELLKGADPGQRLWAEVARTAALSLDPPDDVHASGTYRREVAEVLVARALQTAWQSTR